MYKPGVRSMPKCFKREILSIIFKFGYGRRSIEDILPIEKSDVSKNEIYKIIKTLLLINNLPSFWLVYDSVSRFRFLVFERKLSTFEATHLQSNLKENKIFCFSSESLSNYYGIY